MRPLAQEASPGGGSAMTLVPTSEHPEDQMAGEKRVHGPQDTARE